MKPTNYRKERMSAGEVFLGIKTKDNKMRAKIESERHNKFMDMQGNGPKIQAGFKNKQDPVKWMKDFVRNVGVERAFIRTEEILKELQNSDGITDPLMKPYLQNQRVEKDIVFYKNAYAYLKNNYKRS